MLYDVGHLQRVLDDTFVNTPVVIYLAQQTLTYLIDHSSCLIHGSMTMHVAEYSMLYTSSGDIQNESVSKQVDEVQA